MAKENEIQHFKDIDHLIDIYNHTYEGDIVSEKEINDYILSNQLLKNVMRNIGRGCVIEVGPYKGRFLETLSFNFKPELSEAFVLGIDSADYVDRPVEANYEEVTIDELICADHNQILLTGALADPPDNNLHVWRLKDASNTYAVYGIPAEEALARETKTDLLILKFVMGYLLEKKTIKTLEYSLFSKAKSIFMIDYVGKTDFTETQIPRPETIARYLPGMEVAYEQHQKHFILFATSEDRLPLL